MLTASADGVGHNASEQPGPTSEGEVAERGGAVIYAVGTPGTPGTEVPALRAYVASEGWALIDICFDHHTTAHPAARPGLRAALDRLRLGSAATLVLDHLVYAAMSEPSWLDAVVRTHGGSLHRVTPDDNRRALADDRPRVNADALSAFRAEDQRPELREAG